MYSSTPGHLRAPHLNSVRIFPEVDSYLHHSATYELSEGQAPYLMVYCSVTPNLPSILYTHHWCSLDALTRMVLTTTDDFRSSSPSPTAAFDCLYSHCLEHIIFLLASKARALSFLGHLPTFPGLVRLFPTQHLVLASVRSQISSPFKSCPSTSLNLSGFNPTSIAT